MKRCMVCNRPLKSVKAVALGIGPRCKKKVDPEAVKEAQVVLQHGFDAELLEGRVIQLGMRVDDSDEPPRILNIPKE